MTLNIYASEGVERDGHTSGESEALSKKTIAELRDRQNADGSWTFCFEGPIMTNSFFILLLTSLDDGENEKN